MHMLYGYDRINQFRMKDISNKFDFLEDFTELKIANKMNEYIQITQEFIFSKRVVAFPPELVVRPFKTTHQAQQ